MQENRMFSDVKLAKRLTPAWFSPFLAALLIIAGQIIGAVIMAFSAALLAVPYFLNNPQIANKLSSPTILQELLGDYYLLLSFFSFVFIAGLFLLWVKFFEQRPIVTLGFYKDNWKKELLKGFGLGLLLFSIVMLILILTGSYQLVGTTFTPYAFGFVLLTIPFWLIQGGTEELVTRGWLLPVMAEKSNKIIAIVVSSSLFGLLHMFNSGFTMQSLINLILFGVLETFYIIKTDNLWGAAGIHGAWNFAQGNIFGVLVSGSTTGSSLLQFAPGSGPDWLTGGSFGAAGAIVCTLVMLVTILILAYQLKKSGKLFVRKSAEKPAEATSVDL